jgi:predicted PurR-regulated permease PerM
MIQQYTQQNKVFFYVIMTVLGALGLWLISGYLGIIVFSLVMVIILKPVYDFFERLLKGRAGLATTATIVALFLAILIPSWIMLRIVTNQVNTIIESFTFSESGELLTLEDFQGQVNELVNQVPFADQLAFLDDLQLTDEQVAEINQALLSAAAWAGQVVVNLGMSIPDLIARLFIFLAIVGVLLPNYRGFVQRLIYLSPLDDEVDRIYLRKIKAMVWSMFIGIVVIAVVQGLITGLFFWFSGVSYTPLWTLIAIIASTLPLGASLIAIPVAIFQLIMGNYVGALIVLGGYILVVTNIDNILRPKLVSKEAYLDAALVLVAALGGYDLFGFFGVIYGPVLMVLVMTTIEVYGKYYASQPKLVPANDSEVKSVGISGDHLPVDE